MMNFVCYFIVSTDRQGRLGLGLEAQRGAVLNYIFDRVEILFELIEIKSRKNYNRPALVKALTICR